jgi:hypothetical protein
MILLYFIRSWWEYLLGTRKPSVVAWRSALSSFSFRIPRGQAGSARQVFNWMVFAIALSQRKPGGRPAGEILVLDDYPKKADARRKYVSTIFGEDVSFISYYSICIVRHRISIIKLVKIFSLIILLFPYLIYSNKRASIALVIYDFIMLELLDELVKGSPVKRIIWFGAFEKGTPLLIDWFRRYRGIEVTIVPSTNPLRNFYRHVVADKVVLTAPFQQEEVGSGLSEGWVQKECVWWPPYGHERMLEVAGRKVQRGVIGFMSSGNWLRRELGKDQLDPEWEQAEITVLRWCQLLVQRRQGVALRVFLHPLEKKDPTLLARALAHYGTLGIPATDIVSDRGGIAHPELMDVAVALYSSALFERLYAGYKCVFAQPGMAPGYFMNGSIRNIIAHDEADFQMLLVQALGQEEDAYFISNGMDAYRMQGHPAGVRSAAFHSAK